MTERSRAKDQDGKPKMERRLLTLPSGLRNAIVRYRYEAQIPTENEATRRLIEAGLTAHDPGWRNWRRKKDGAE